MKVHFYLLLFVLPLYTLQSCRGQEKLLEKEKYDLIIKRSEYISKYKKENPFKWVVATETAFAAANKKDWAFTGQYEKEGGISAWKKVYQTAQRIYHRQQKVNALSPLVAENGYIASFPKSNAVAKIEEAKSWIANLYFSLAKKRMEAVRAGSKKAALRTIRLLDSATTWRPDIYMAKQMRREAMDSAVVRIGVYFYADNQPQYVADDIEERLYLGD